MTALEIQSVIDRIGYDIFYSMVAAKNFYGKEDTLEYWCGKQSPSDPFRQELRKAVRWVVEHGMPQG